jgi:predicted metal-binding membrane protein
MEEMPMPGGWTMSMAWMRMPGQSWPGAAASFLGMWVVMMVPMMLPSLVLMLLPYRKSGRLTALVTLGLGYFFVWTVIGAAVFPIGVALAAIEMQQPMLARGVPIAVCAVVLAAGAFQFTRWKARHLACCREAPEFTSNAGTAFRHGLRLGLRCARCCGNLMAILLVIGVMDLRAMAVVTVAITLERLLPSGERAARAVGAAVVGSGLFLIAQAAVPG